MTTTAEVHANWLSGEFNQSHVARLFCHSLVKFRVHNNLKLRGRDMNKQCEAADQHCCERVELSLLFSSQLVRQTRGSTSLAKRLRHRVVDNTGLRYRHLFESYAMLYPNPIVEAMRHPGGHNRPKEQRGCLVAALCGYHVSRLDGWELPTTGS